MDDIIVSCNDLAKLEEACVALIPAAMRAGLAFNAAKCEGPATTITAFNVELTHANLAIIAERLEEFGRDLRLAGELRLPLKNVLLNRV